MKLSSEAHIFWLDIALSCYLAFPAGVLHTSQINNLYFNPGFTVYFRVTPKQNTKIGLQFYR